MSKNGIHPKNSMCNVMVLVGLISSLHLSFAATAPYETSLPRID